MGSVLKSRVLYYVMPSIIKELYWIEASLPVTFAFSASSSDARCSRKTATWHRHLGHVRYDTLAWMCSLNMLTWPTLKPAHFLQARSEPCEICTATKQLAKPHTSLTEHPALVPLGCILSNITGNPADGLYATLLDECTKWAPASHIAHKSAEEVLAFISEAIEMLQTQTCFKLKRFRNDGGREYDNALLPA